MYVLQTKMSYIVDVRQLYEKLNWKFEHKCVECVETLEKTSNSFTIIQKTFLRLFQKDNVEECPKEEDVLKCDYADNV